MHQADAQHPQHVKHVQQVHLPAAYLTKETDRETEIHLALWGMLRMLRMLNRVWDFLGYFRSYTLLPYSLSRLVSSK